MVSKIKKTWALFFAVLCAAAVFLVSMTATVWAQNDDGATEQKDKKSILEEMKNDSDSLEIEGLTGVHKDPTVFQKNFVLSPQQKEEAIAACEEFVAKYLNDDMSDLEKYYTLAIQLNKHVNYDWDFWPGGYDMDFYRHQWDAYGVLIQREAVCAGIAITYANLCHAADLPCKFVRIKSDTLDHTISYIPDINGKAYYLDVTEDIFFMSKKTNTWGTIDIAFSEIKKKNAPSNSPFDYHSNGSVSTTTIKELYDTPFDVWFKEYALHKDTKKDFRTPYVEKGNGLRASEAGYAHASYSNYPRQIVYKDYDKMSRAELDFAAKPGLWFMDDFYADPKNGSTDAIINKILNREFDEQLLNVSLKDNYDCATSEELIKAVKGDISVRYFPSEDGGKVVAKAAELTCDTDYTVTCDSFDPGAGKAVLTIKGTGNGDGYTGEYQVTVMLNSAAVTKAPAPIKGLGYTGSPMALIEGGEAENGTLVYAVNQNADAEPKDEEYTGQIPAATKPGKYYVWYKVIGTDGHFDTQPQKTEVPASIAFGKTEIIADDITLEAGRSFKLAPEIDTGQSAEYAYFVYDSKIATVSADGTVKAIAGGTTKIDISANLTDSDPNYRAPDSKLITVTVTKKANTLDVKGKPVTVKYKELKKKAQILSVGKVIRFTKKGEGKKTYKLLTAEKEEKSFRKYFRINKKNGQVTVRKKLKKGTYEVSVKVRAAGNGQYEAATVTVTFSVRV